jgi:hypothetical protein
VLAVAEDTDADLRFSWDDRLVVQVNDQQPIDLGQHEAFRSKSVHVNLRKGANTVLATLSNTTGTNHGGWAFAMRATTASGATLLPMAAPPTASQAEKTK